MSTMVEKYAEQLVAAGKFPDLETALSFLVAAGKRNAEQESDILSKRFEGGYPLGGGNRG